MYHIQQIGIATGLLLNLWFFLGTMPAQSNPLQDSLFSFHQAMGSSECFGVAFGDVDGDGVRDAIVVNFQGQSRLWKNEGNGNFTSTGQTFGSGTNHGGDLADLDGDGDLDLFLVSTMATGKVYFNDGTGNFTDSGQNLGGAMDFSVQVILEDMDGDSDPDALVARNMHTNLLWINDGSGFFTESRDIGDTTTYFMRVADVEGDGDPDVYVEYQNQPDRILLNNGTGQFTDSGQAIGSAEGDGQGVFYDLDDDSDPDLVLTNSISGNRIWLNDGMGLFSASGSAFGSGYSLTVLDVDMDTDPDVITFHPENPCYLWLNDGNMDYDSAGVIFPGDECWSITPEDVDLDGDIDVVTGNSAFNGGVTKLWMNQSSPSTGEAIFPVNTNDKLHIYPNPVIRDVTLSFTLEREASLKLMLFDISMQRVGLLAEGLFGRGEHRVMKALEGFTNGLYYVLMLSDDSASIHRIFLYNAN